MVATPFALDLTGTLLDRRYRITGLLGKGGMGQVYDAVHVALEQQVAIKVLDPRFAAEERFRERFIREARSASRIPHRNVVRISDFGDTDGSVYFVMERLEGHDIGEELRRSGAMAWTRARHILIQAVGALRAAHAKDIIHRDIKPANCFLTTEAGVVDFVKLLDFGIAKVGSDANALGRGLTATGEVFGTAAYMAPEQARGNELDARSDMYSLGIMAYEMLTGRVPFIGVNSIHVVTKHINEPPVPLRVHDPSIPAEVEAVVLKMIAKEAGGRYESMDALEEALQSIQEWPGHRRTKIWDGSSPVAAPKPHPMPGRRDPSVPPPPGAPAVPPPGAFVPMQGYHDPIAPPSPSAFGPAPGGHDPSISPLMPGSPMAFMPSVAAPSAWSTGPTNAGPWMSANNSSSVTNPRSPLAAGSPGITGPMLVVLLVLLVGGGSAVATMIFLTSQEKTQANSSTAPAPEPSPSERSAE